MSTVDKANKFLKEFADWAMTQSDIKAVALVGSYARNAAAESSDIDLVLITSRTDKYLQSREWIEQFGKSKKQQTEDYGLLTSIRVWYAQGIELEYGITNEDWAAVPLDEGTRRVLSNGVKIIFERETILSRHLTSV